MKERISDRIRASDERCIACQEFLRQATDLVAMSRDAIARSREKLARLGIKTSTTVSSAGEEAPSGADALQSPILAIAQVMRRPNPDPRAVLALAEKLPARRR